MKLFKLSKTEFTWRFYLFPRVKVHWIRSTVDEWHTHPWNGLSIILGWYWEQIGDIPDWCLSSGQLHIEPATKWKLRWGWNWIGAFTPHRTKGNCLTLFIHGPRINENWFWGNERAPWRGVQNQ